VFDASRSTASSWTIPPRWSHIDGVAASSAATMAMAGDEIRITEAGFLMIHNASGGVFGEAKDMRQMADLLDTISSTIGDVYAARTKQRSTR
jgi:ATP-dependent Clp protease protease subunit